MSTLQKSRLPIHILIVEDDLVDRMACRRTLLQDTDHEFELSEADTGREGLLMAHAQKPDCILLDYHLPDMDGLAFLDALRNDLGDIPVPVMMLTGADNAAIAVNSMKRGAQDYLVKDVNRQYLELLPAVIQRVLRERRTIIGKKQAEENLLQAETKYRFLVEQIPAIIYTTVLHTPDKLSYISPQISQLGFSPEEWLLDPDGTFAQIHADDKMLVQEEISLSYKSGQPMRCEYRLITRAGQLRWYLNEASLVRQTSGEPLYLQGVLVDITEDKKIEEELQLHRRRLEELVTIRTTEFEKQTAILASANASLSNMLVECKQARTELKKKSDQFADLYHNAPCSCFSLKADGKFVQINDAGLEWLGRTRDEVVGKIKFIELLTPESARTFLESNQSFRESGWICDLQLDILREDGTKLPVLLNANSNKDSAGHLVMSRFVMLDMSNSKHA